MTLLPGVPAWAQLDGSHLLGDDGVGVGTQPQPGFCGGPLYHHHDTGTLKDAEGDTVRLSPGSPTSVGLDAVAPLVWHVSEIKILDANYGAQVVFPFASDSIEAPAFELTDTIGTGFSDLLARPLDPGWHMKKADVSAGVQFHAPTGRYEPGATADLGRGTWTYEPFVGTTVYLDEKRTFGLATTAFFEMHSDKRDSDVKVGSVLTLEDGAGKSFLGGGLVIGAADYAQWKLTEDRLGQFTLPGGGVFEPTLANQHGVLGLGPDVTVPIATRSKLDSLVNFRYFWETGARSKTQGQSLVVTATNPIPRVKLK